MSKRTKRVVRIVLLLGTAISLFFVPWTLVWAWILPLPDTVQEQADKAIDHGFEGIVVYVDQKGQPPAFYTAGWHDKKNKIPAKEDALFKIGSISKLYTAVAVTKLINDKRLSQDKSLADYLPEFLGRIENSEKITIKMLVQHRSGIPNYSDTPDYWAHPKDTDKKKLELILDSPANFDPGEQFEYCNTNYVLLSMIMDKVLGYEHFQFIQEEILDRLNLKSTYASLNEVNIENVMSGYHVGHDADLKSDKMGMLATAEDVGIFLRALNDGTLFDAGERKLYVSLYELKHSGWVPGYQSFAEYHQDIDAVVVQFYNTTDPDLYLWNLAEIVNTRIVKIVRKK